jgi:hypothetical protein
LVAHRGSGGQPQTNRKHLSFDQLEAGFLFGRQERTR